MPESIKHVFSNHGIPPRKRVMGPIISAIVSFFLPGSAQALNGQVVKGAIIMLFWLLMYSVAQINAVFYNIVRVLQYIIMVVVSSDAYFIASRMKLGEEVRAWSILFLDIHAPTGAVGGDSRQAAGQRTLIADVTVVDGTGAAPFRSDVLLEGGIIRYIRPSIPRQEKEYTIVEGTGRVLIPGFINPCCCREAAVFGQPESIQAIRQGFTTEMLGQNGQSLAPVRASGQQAARQRFSAVHGSLDKETFFDNTGLYLMGLERLHSPARLESFLGYGTLRATVAGCQMGMPDGQELEQLCSRIRSGLASGAKGISLGLAYPPCSYLEDGELEAVFRITAECGGRLSIQLPLGAEQLLPSLERLGRLAQTTGAALTITNLHAPGAGRELAEEACRLCRQLRAEGMDLSLAVTGLSVQPVGLMALTPETLWTDLEVFPLSWAGQRESALADSRRRLDAVGGPEALTLPFLEGAPTLEQEAARRGCPPEELVLRLLEEHSGSAHVLLHTKDEAFLARLLEEPYTGLCTDGLSAGEQAACALPWFLGRYVEEQRVLSLEDAVHRCTMRPAAQLRLWDRGLIREGMAADLVLLRPALLPRQPGDDSARGISKVWVGGVLQYDTEASATLEPMHTPRMFGIRMS